jgi:histidinol-phosphate aminotransferase
LTSGYSTLDEILARLQSYEGYASARAGESSGSDLIGLDSNENYFSDAESIRKMARKAAQCDLRIYPREEMTELREKLASWLEVKPECVVLANGEDQLIDMAAAVLSRGGSAVSVSPTYSMYRLRLELIGGKLIQVPLRKDFSLDVERLLSVADESRASMMFLCSPNNPTANQFPEASIVQVLNGFRGLVILDEAYVEFADRSAVHLVREYSSLAVMRTFSKAFGIAGARLGYMVANPRLSKIFAEKAQLPYPISRFTARLGIECLRNLKTMHNSVSEMKQEKSWLIDQLRRLEGVRVFDSQANFVLVCTGRNSSRVSARLRSLGILVRDFSDVLGFRGCVRVTIGPRPMSEKFLDALEEVMRDEQL